MTLKRRFRPLSGVLGRVFLTVLVATACLYSLLGSFGFLYIANNGRGAIQNRIEGVVDHLECRRPSASAHWRPIGSAH